MLRDRLVVLPGHGTSLGRLAKVPFRLLQQEVPVGKPPLAVVERDGAQRMAQIIGRSQTFSQRVRIVGSDTPVGNESEHQSCGRELLFQTGCGRSLVSSRTPAFASSRHLTHQISQASATPVRWTHTLNPKDPGSCRPREWQVPEFSLIDLA